MIGPLDLVIGNLVACAGVAVVTNICLWIVEPRGSLRSQVLIVAVVCSGPLVVLAGLLFMYTVLSGGRIW